MRRIPSMSALALIALAGAPIVRAQAAARQRQEENISRCRVLAQIFGMPTDEVQRQAAELDWDMRALQQRLEGPPTQIAGCNLPVLASRELADVITFDRVQHRPHRELPLSALIAQPTPPQKPRRRSKRAQRARRSIWNHTT